MERLTDYRRVNKLSKLGAESSEGVSLTCLVSAGYCLVLHLGCWSEPLDLAFPSGRSMQALLDVFIAWQLGAQREDPESKVEVHGIFIIQP